MEARDRMLGLLRAIPEVRTPLDDGDIPSAGPDLEPSLRACAGVQWELRPVLALRDQPFASALPLGAHTPARFNALR
jgi:hypothetical protein